MTCGYKKKCCNIYTHIKFLLRKKFLLTISFLLKRNTDQKERNKERKKSLQQIKKLLTCVVCFKGYRILQKKSGIEKKKRKKHRVR